jgi:4-amino-4-deoxy-L-arabinose transferase-like glycosyltransferase
MYIQNGEFWPYHAIVDANNHILNSGLSYICFKLFGSSLLALRLPNLLAFLLMAMAVYRLLFHLKSSTARLVLVALFLLSFNWLSFYSLCRGYGLSMALLLVSLVLVLEYFKNPKRWLFYGFLLAIQLAIAANLTLLIIALIVTTLVLFYQLINKKLLDIWLLPGYLMHALSLYLWIGFSFFLQKGNALYYGQGDDYWEITFKTLIELISGWENNAVDVSIAVLVLIATGFSVYLIAQANLKEKIMRMNALLFFTVIFTGALFSFYFLHLLKDVNYPEDRTGLFFYPIAALMIVFLIDSATNQRMQKLFLTIPAMAVIHFCLLLNFKNHAINEYETFPERFYLKLLEEQEKSKEKITISGHRLNELMFAFMNYNHGGGLNPVDDAEELNVYGDYALTKTKDLKVTRPITM